MNGGDFVVRYPDFSQYQSYNPEAFPHSLLPNVRFQLGYHLDCVKKHIKQPRCQPRKSSIKLVIDKEFIDSIIILVRDFFSCELGG